MSSATLRLCGYSKMRATILIVDDEKHTRDGLRRLLEDEYDTYVAEDIRGAMDVLERRDSRAAERVVYGETTTVPDPTMASVVRPSRKMTWWRTSTS